MARMLRRPSRPLALAVLMRVANTHLPLPWLGALGLMLTASPLVNCQTTPGCPDDHDGDATTACSEAELPPNLLTTNASGSFTAGAGGYSVPDPNACSDPDACDEGFFCLFEGASRPTDGQFGPYCGGRGACTPVPKTCDDTWAPVCTCHGFVAGNRCKGQQRGADMFIDADDCPPPPGLFPCGHTYCHTDTEYCEAVKRPDSPDRGTCLPLPGACESSASCACIATATCNVDGAPPTECDDEQASGLTLTCITD